MMNRVDLIGRLTRDLELRRANSGMSILRFTVAVDRRRKQPGEQSADFISCVAFGKTAENMARFLHKGSMISVEGRIQTGSYVNQQGQKVYTTDVIADSVQFLEPRSGAGQGYGQSNDFDGGMDAYGSASYGGNAGYGYSQPSSPNPYAQSVDNGFGAPSKPAASSNAYSAPAASHGDEHAFDEADTLDIASDDLPF